MRLVFERAESVRVSVEPEEVDEPVSWEYIVSRVLARCAREGMCIRSPETSSWTVTPVLFGDSGLAIIGGGTLCLFRYVGARSVYSADLLPIVSVDGEGDTGGGELSASFDLTLSSHFPRTRSRLPPTLCAGAHLRVAVPEPVEPMLAIDPDRPSVPPRPDDVRSSSRC